MRGYSGLSICTSACVRFIRNDEVDESLTQVFREIRNLGMECTYVDFQRVRADNLMVVDGLAGALKLDHWPYGSRRLVQFLDDLITLSYHRNGLVIVIDAADVFLAESRNEMFDLIEAFLIQFHHWFEKKKPCYLCFQMEHNALVREVFTVTR